MAPSAGLELAMTILQSPVRDIAGADDRTIFVFEVPGVRGGTDGGVVTSRQRRYTATDGVLTTDDLEPGHAVLRLSSGAQEEYHFVIPEPDESNEPVPLWPLIEAYVEYTPPVVSQVHEHRLRAEAAADAAEAAAASVQDVAEDAAAVAADRAAVESARSEVETTAASVSTDAAAASMAATAAGTARDAAEDARDDAVAARDDAEIARDTAAGSASAATVSADTAGTHASNAASSASIAAGHASDAEDSAQAAAQSAQDAADTVNSGVPNATGTVKGGIMLAGDLGGTFDAPTVPGLSEKLDQSQVDARVSAGIADWVNSAPAALDTLEELATALGNDPNFATTVSNQIGLKAPLESPALTGTPTVGGKAVVVTDDPRLSDARTPTSHTHPASDIQGSTTVGRAVLSAADGAAARSAIGAARADMMPELVSELPASPVTGKLYCLPEE